MEELVPVKARRRDGKEPFTVSEMRTSAGVPSGRSRMLTGGRKMELMLAGRNSRKAFWTLVGGPSVGIKKVIKKLWWKARRLASSVRGMR